MARTISRMIAMGVAGALLCVGLTAQSKMSTTDRITEEATEHSQAWEILEHLADFIGPRPAGSRQAAAAVEWTASQLRSWGLDVHLEPVTVTPWIRGEERASLPSQFDQKIVVTALGGSVATPWRGLPRRSSSRKTSRTSTGSVRTRGGRSSSTTNRWT